MGVNIGFGVLQLGLAIATAVMINESKKDGSYDIRSVELIVVVVNVVVSCCLKLYLLVIIYQIWRQFANQGVKS